MAFVRGRPKALENGLAVLMLLRPWEKGGLSKFFFPFALYTEVNTADIPVRDGMRAKIIANSQAVKIIDTANSMIKPTRAIKAEIEERLKRSPILLPLRHFASDELAELLITIGEGIKEQVNPKCWISDKCREFERIFPFKKTGGKQGQFSNRNGINFTMPGRALHGEKGFVSGNGHNDMCFLNGKLRLGGPIADGFHYDCTAGGNCHSGNFCNCHDENDQYKGNPHLNIYSNDYIRE
jgi:hypothetical protein